RLRHGDVEVHAETLATEEIDPAARLFVQMRLDPQLVAVLLHADLEVLQPPLRAVLARRGHVLGRDHADLPRLTHADPRLTWDVAHAKPRHALEDELALHG